MQLMVKPLHSFDLNGVKQKGGKVLSDAETAWLLKNDQGKRKFCVAVHDDTEIGKPQDAPVAKLLPVQPIQSAVTEESK